MVIGHGPERSLASSIFLIVFGILFAGGAAARGTRQRGAFSYGKGPGVPISTAGRVILALMAFVMIVYGVAGLVR